MPPLQWLGFNGPDIDALLGTGKMHVLSTAHCTQLLGPWLPLPLGSGEVDPSVSGGAAAAHSDGPPPPPLRLLDIGAGSGEVTQAIASGIQHAALATQGGGAAAAPAAGNTASQLQVTATDSSAACARALVAKGFHGIHCDSIDASRAEFATDGHFHVVACLNVLDRCSAPRDLLRDAVRLCAEGGLLVFALVLPWDDFVEEGGVQKQPEAPLPMAGFRCGDGPGLEECLGAFLRNVLGVAPGATGEGSFVPEGTLTLRSVSRVPYLAEGDLFASVYWLPNAVVVCSKNGMSQA